MAVDYSKVVKYTVVKGDTLSGIVSKYMSTYGDKLGFTPNNSTQRTRYQNYIAEQNDIKNVDLIIRGEKLIIYSPKGKTVKTSTSSTSSSKKAVVTRFGIQNGTDNVLYATWKWDKDNTDRYKTRWRYSTGDGVSWIGKDSDSTTANAKQDTYTIPSNATYVTFYVKPVSKKKKVTKNGKTTETSYWTADWSDAKKYTVILKPATPSAPKVTIDGTQLTAELRNINDGLDENQNATTNYIQFQIVKNDSSKAYKTSEKIKVTSTVASFTYNVSPGGKYKVRCRAYHGDVVSEDWSSYSDNVETTPGDVKSITSLKALTENSVFIDWDGVTAAKNYEIQWTTEKKYFDSSREVQSITVSADEVSHAEITGLETGTEYFFRVRATNNQGESAWTAIKSVKLGIKPDVPTTWSSTTTVVAGETLTLYWVHNTEDGSSMHTAQLEKTIGSNQSWETHPVSDPEDQDANKVHSVTINTSGYEDGVNIKWRVRTKGIIDTWSPWSTLRTVKVYSRPSVDLEVLDSRNPKFYKVTYNTSTEKYVATTDRLSSNPNGSRYNNAVTEEGYSVYSYMADGKREFYHTTFEWGDVVDTLTSFPFYVKAKATSTVNQKPISYHLSITANNDYETEDEIGNVKMVKKGDIMFSEHYDKPSTIENVGISISAKNIDLANNMSYTVTVIAAMSSGLTATANHTFSVSWSEQDYEPDAEIGIDKDTLAAVIQPYCETYKSRYYRVIYDDTTGEYTIANVWWSPGKRSGTLIEDAYAEFVDDGTLVEDEFRGQIDEGMYPVYLATDGKDSVSDYYTKLLFNTKELVSDIWLSVYRREFDGTFTELATNLENKRTVYIVDPHPALDYARYRIVSTDKGTGAVGYWDLPGYPVGEPSIVIQWDEAWSEFDTNDGNAQEDMGWTGSMLKLPYDISVSDNNQPDVELVEYIGRENPVSYYGTQQGYSSTWTTNIPKEDKDTLYALRRLQRWMGDVYVREPSGSGYWANITVQFSQKSRELTIPVTFNIKRVEGGM